MGTWKIPFRSIAIGAALVLVGWGVLLGVVCGCAPKVVGVAGDELKPKTGTTATAENVGGDMETTSNVYNLAGSAGWVLALPLTLLAWRQRTSLRLIDRLVRGIELASYGDAPGPPASIKKRIYHDGIQNGPIAYDAAERLLRLRLDRYGWRN